jgi:hypothetical protein
MHYAHKLLEALKPDSEDYGRVMRAVKFDLGDYDAFDSAASMVKRPEFMRSPFPVCLLQASSSHGVHLWLVFNEKFSGFDAVHVTCFFKNAGTQMEWSHASIHLRVFCSTDTDASRLGFFSHADDDITDEVMSDPAQLDWGEMLVDVFRVVEVFSCCNVAHVEHVAPKLINKQRAKKLKPPIFSYRTLHLIGDEAPAQGDVGRADRTSPRLHLRRGHIRRLVDGRRVWVRSAVVGSRAAGFVHKDYALH